jgi:Glycosyl transferase 4-like domain
LFAAHACCFDTTNGASVANRTLARALARNGCVVEVFSESPRLHDREVDPSGRPGAVSPEDWAEAVFSLGVGGLTGQTPPHGRLVDRGVPTTLHQPALGPRPEPGEDEAGEFLRLFDEILGRFRPDVLVGYGGDPIALAMFAHARRLGISTVFTLHNFQYRGTPPFQDVDLILVASRFSAEFHREAIDLDCTTIPHLVDGSRVVLHLFDVPGSRSRWFLRLGAARAAQLVLVGDGDGERQRELHQRDRDQRDFTGGGSSIGRPTGVRSHMDHDVCHEQLELSMKER